MVPDRCLRTYVDASIRQVIDSNRSHAEQGMRVLSMQRPADSSGQGVSAQLETTGRGHNSLKPVSFDLNYRATLTTPAEARAVLETAAPHIETLILAERDAQSVLGFTEAGERLAEAVSARYGIPQA